MSAQLLAGLGVLAGAVVHGFGLWRRPYARCRSCGGSGQSAGSRRGRPFGKCPACKDKKPRPRAGAAVVAALLGEKHGKRYW